jgi:hypothetical protein
VCSSDLIPAGLLYRLSAAGYRPPTIGYNPNQ